MLQYTSCGNYEIISHDNALKLSHLSLPNSGNASKNNDLIV